MATTKEAGEDLFRLACEYDLEGVVAKQKFAPYTPEPETTWLKIRNRSYSQWAGREELFERERGRNPDVQGWDAVRWRAWRRQDSAALRRPRTYFPSPSVID